MHKSIILVMAGILILGLERMMAEPPAKRPPNIVIILADDLGWGDLGVHGGKVQTPVIDKFFRDNVQLENFMVCPCCTPTRAGLMTGRNSLRINMGPFTDGELSTSEVTMAQALKANGYITGVFGKWHLGVPPVALTSINRPPRKGFMDGTEDIIPLEKIEPPAEGGPISTEALSGPGAPGHGFDVSRVYYGGGGTDRFFRVTVSGGLPCWFHDKTPFPDEKGTTPELIVKYATEFIHENKDRPFFAYVPFDLVHKPFQCLKKYVDRGPASETDPSKRLYNGMIVWLDDCVGQVLDSLDKNGVADNTIVIFFSDNGAIAQVGSNLPFRGFKFSTWEGGVHSPTAIRWPAGGIGGPKGPGVVKALMGHLDVYPTFMSLAGLKRPDGPPLDGVDVSQEILHASSTGPVDSYYWYLGDHDVVSTQDWKLSRYMDHDELYQVRKDISESADVAKEHPDIVKQLTEKLEQWRKSMGVALGHVPPSLGLAGDADEAKPEGDVLEISARRTEGAGKKTEPLIVQFATISSFDKLSCKDYLEFDICFSKESQPGGVYCSTVEGGKKGRVDAKMGRAGNVIVNYNMRKGRTGVDQFGRPQFEAPLPKGGLGLWEHRIIGLGFLAPGAPHSNLPFRYAAIFNGATPGLYKIYLDNVRILHDDGSTTPVWIDRSSTHVDIAPSDDWKDAAAQAIPVASAR